MLEFFEKLNNSKVFKDWRKENEDFFLCGCFTMIGEKEEFWQFDFYNKNTGKISSFKVDNEIEIIPNDDVFSEDKDAIRKVRLEKVKTDIKEILNDVDKNYNGVEKKIVILQEREELIWNITLLLSDMKVVNLNISAESGEILKECSENILNFRKN